MRIVEHKKFKECEQRENFILNNFSIRSPILIIRVLLFFD